MGSSVTTPKPGTISPFGNETLPGLPGGFTLPTLNLSSFTMPTFAPISLANFTVPTFGTLPPLNLTFPALPTIAPFNLANFTFPTLGSMSPLNLSLPTLPTMAPLNLSGLPTLPSLNLASLTLPTFAPLNLSNLPTLAPLNLSNFTLPTMGTFPTLNLANFSIPTMAPLNLSALPTLPPMPTIAPLGNFTFGPLPTMASFFNMTMPSLFGSGNTTSGSILHSNVTLPTSDLKNSTATPVLLGDITVPHFGNMTMTTTMPGGVPLMMTTTKSGGSTPCGSTTCTTDQVCASPWNATQTCIKRLPDRRYCIDNPCATGMKCFDNTTSNAYTCYTKLDGAAGECLGIQCSPGDICYQVMGQQAKCIQLHQAPQCLGQNEEFSACKSGCESTCSTPFPPCMNSTTCTSGCACIRGYVRLNGVCELMNKCPTTTTGSVTCGGAEEYLACKPACEKSCSGIPTKACQLSLNSTTIAPTTCTPGCSCRPAYKRDTDSGQCVHARQCFHTTTCGLNESWSKCHNCESMCGQTANPSCKACWSGCGCNQGYSRSTSGVCVESTKCS
ncbi:hypothetical protein CRE_07804 [Caenorhabditis remanei]|uniref:Uncharacterized protein n=1 Tax=Caenorhabditis remanei TaxID=31234 RepID=E3NB78_CAERE|nr:hypothetical protein CRE_07804 [Caenorhabditis remanei]